MTKKLYMTLFAGIFILMAPSISYSAEKFTGVTHLRAILTSQPPTELGNKAAGILSKYFEKMYGKKIPINPAELPFSPDVTDVILIGRKAAIGSGMISETELEKIKYDGFVIRAQGGRIALAGFRNQGSVYAVYELLERLGCRFYVDDGKCETIPSLKTTLIDDFYIADKPFFEFRGTWQKWIFKMSFKDVGEPRHALNPELFTKEAGSNLWLAHTSGYLVPKLLYYDEHPEYFAMLWDGRRIPKKTRDSHIHLCLSNPDVIKISTDRVLKWIRLQPERRFFFITQGDGVNWCQCKNCLAMDVMTGNYSDRFLKYINHIALAVKKEFPDKTLLTFAYVGTDIAPVNEKPKKNVWVLYAPYWGLTLSVVHPLTHPSNRESLLQFEAWRKVAPDNLGIFDYNLFYVPSWDAMAEKMKWYARKGVKAIFFNGHPSCFREMFRYITGKLTWDPSLDPEELKKDFVYAYYGPAAPYVMEYLGLVKNRLKEGYPKGQHNNHMPAEFYLDNGFGEKCLAVFDKMIEASKGNTNLGNKIQSERAMFVEDQKNALNTKKKEGTYKPTEPEKLPNGIRLPSTAFQGGHGPMKNDWHCEPRMTTFVYTERAPRPSRMKAEFILDSNPAGETTLKIEAQDADKELPPQTSIVILINNKKIFEGPCGFVKRGWSWRSFKIKKGILKKGKNVIEINNITDSGRLDHYWFALSEAQILFEL